MKTVLIVDDSKVVRAMVACYLKTWGCHLIEAADGRQGVELARQHKPDLILLDMTMPLMGGREALGEIRKDPVCKNIPVIMLTADRDRDIVAGVGELGVVGYIVKPFQKEALDSGVSRILGARAQAAAGLAAAQTGASEAPVDYSSVLVVDDSERVLDAARAALEQGLRVLTATSGAQALERYREARPGVVVVDLAMPGMDGFETIMQLKPLGNSAYIALATPGDTKLHDKAKQAGYQGIIDKPFRATELAGQVLAAASARVSPDQLVRGMLTEESGCSVLRLPDISSNELFGRIIPAVARRLRVLAEGGAGKLIVDTGNATESSTELVAALAGIVTEAGTLGIRTAICARNERLIARLRRLAETRSAPCGQNREAALASLQ